MSILCAAPTRGANRDWPRREAALLELLTTCYYSLCQVLLIGDHTLLSRPLDLADELGSRICFG